MNYEIDKTDGYILLNNTNSNNITILVSKLEYNKKSEKKWRTEED